MPGHPALERAQKVLSGLGLASRREAEAWRAMGNVVDVIQKPFNINNLIAQIGDLCEERAAAIGS